MKERVHWSALSFAHIGPMIDVLFELLRAQKLRQMLQNHSGCFKVTRLGGDLQRRFANFRTDLSIRVFIEQKSKGYGNFNLIKVGRRDFLKFSNKFFRLDEDFRIKFAVKEIQ